jgi:hypothetical protein
VNVVRKTAPSCALFPAPTRAQASSGEDTWVSPLGDTGAARLKFADRDVDGI